MSKKKNKDEAYYVLYILGQDTVITNDFQEILKWVFECSSQNRVPKLIVNDPNFTYEQLRSLCEKGIAKIEYKDPEIRERIRKSVHKSIEAEKPKS